jgi:hypothetical protein
MRPRPRIAAAAALVALLLLVPSVGADQVFHTQRIDLIPVGDAALRTGFVVDVHVNGPQVNALERYVLNGAAPNTTYQVRLLVYGNATCSGNSAIVPTATLATNASGNAEGSWRFVPSDIPETLHGTTIYIVWQLLRDGQVTYHTACIAVAVD